jgi:hypothetical protein
MTSRGVSIGYWCPASTNIVEHPELVCERIVRLARLVGRDNIIAGVRWRP